MTQATIDKPTSNVDRYWRSLAEIEGTDAFQEFLEREFPQAASEFPEGVSRRRWLQLMSASFALAGAAGCRWETEKILPFADRPEGYVPGTTESFATNVSWAGGPRHLLVTKYDGRPVKIEGNPEHPASRGSADAFTQAATLALYDPDRSATVRFRESGRAFTKQWSDFDRFLAERVRALEPAGGAGLAILTSTLDSYTMYDALERVAARFPKARFYRHAPLSRDSELKGAEIALGGRLRTHYRLAGASVIAAFDADPLVAHPDATRMAREFAEGRDPDGKMNRLYAVESQFSATGAAADHRLPMKSSAIGAYLVSLREAIKANRHNHGEPIEGQPTPDEFLEVLADDLLHNRGKSVVIVGPTQPPEVHAIAHEINALLDAVGKTVVYTGEPDAALEFGTLADLTGAIAAGAASGEGGVDTLLILDGNPAYDAPADIAFAAELKNVPHAVRLATHDDETARLCSWSLPGVHPLEEWGDAIAWDGTIGVTQPMIEPLVGGRSKLELLDALLDGPRVDARQRVADAVARRSDVRDDQDWERLLHWGFPADADGKPLDGAGLPVEEASLTGGDFPAPAAPNDETLELVFTASSSTYDGRLANSGWLQETPDFLTKLTWDNAALVAPTTAKELGLVQGELAELELGEKTLTVPVYVMPGQAPGSIGLALGYGRTAAGRVGGYVPEDGEKQPEHPFVNGVFGLWLRTAADPVGVDAYPLRAANGGFATGASIRGLGKSYLLATTQDHHAIDQQGLEAIGTRTGQLIREASQDHYKEHPEFAPHMAHEVQVHDDAAEHGHRPTEPLWKLKEYEGDHAWGMAIDLNKCIGCNACMVACQAENNVPVVGKDQVARGREMHWIRIDRYFKGVADPGDVMNEANFDNPEVAHQPLTCQQCETAPCEQVCPVAATLHDAEGLNNMVYNRCIGTRYCANNCPYKVRRFNYFRYTKPLYEASNELMKLVINPEVTVRSRGVMEKCTFCQQRISTTRIKAKNEGRAIRDGEVQSACQQACPSKAIEFGDLLDESSRVSAAHASPRAYGILSELMTNPRNMFLAKIRNPHPRLYRPEIHDPPAGHGHGGHGDDHGDEHHHDEEHHEAEHA